MSVELTIAEKKLAWAKAHGQKGDVKKAQYELDEVLGRAPKVKK